MFNKATTLVVITTAILVLALSAKPELRHQLVEPSDPIAALESVGVDVEVYSHGTKLTFTESSQLLHLENLVELEELTRLEQGDEEGIALDVRVHVSALDDQALESLTELDLQSLHSLRVFSIDAADEWLLQAQEQLPSLQFSKQQLERFVEKHRLAKLEALELRGVSIPKEILELLPDLALRRIDLALSEVDDQALEACARPVQFKELGLSGTRVTDESMKSVAKMLGLEHIEAQATKVTWYGANSAKEENPTLQTQQVL